MANASWGSVDFDVLWDNPFTVPFPPPKIVTATRKVPFGARVIRQILGSDVSQGQYRVELTQAEYAALVPIFKAGTLATLDIDGDQVRANVFLAGIAEPGEKDATHDLVTVTLTFETVV